MEKGWKDNYKDRSHIALCAQPGFFGEDSEASFWSNLEATKAGEDIDSARAAALQEARVFKQRFEEDVQFVFSRVQHHWHELKNGVRVPLNYCRKKGKKNEHLCRSDFPLRKRCTPKSKVVCKCVPMDSRL